MEVKNQVAYVRTTHARQDREEKHLVLFHGRKRFFMDNIELEWEIVHANNMIAMLWIVNEKHNMKLVR